MFIHVCVVEINLYFLLHMNVSIQVSLLKPKQVCYEKISVLYCNHFYGIFEFVPAVKVKHRPKKHAIHGEMK